ncbi:glycosyltransferase [Bradyrhizobium barranii subsp. apii]|uniref:rhamnosyltransferase WsaF family glycosyltransferase n=1 Tax=Bradyrhizobium barranii TaxID=2992140 RepID=UPI001AA12845|nr:glycosyltransferase [Bradyrhizobium barranii]UPT96059.1 glycosyltransferase [Bradyrhizobium barranii subsp. apii]
MTLQSVSTDGLELLCSLEAPVDRSFHVGKGIALCLQGWAFCPGKIIKRLFVLDGTKRHQVNNHSWVRLDVLDYMYPARDPSGVSLFSGYNAILPIEEISAKERREIILCAELKSGETVLQSLGVLELLPGNNLRPEKVKWPDHGPRVAICMATYNPSRRLLSQQINSILDQDHRNWVCIITDDSTNPISRHDILDLIEHDSRFIYVKNEDRKGFYGNFEGCLSRVPVDADFVALADQDDRWDRDKLSTLLNNIEEKHKLVFSDCRIMAGGKVVSETYWDRRENHYRDFQSNFLANTVPGAASLFRADLLEFLLPFPPKLLGVYHDQWVALVADLEGGISYVDRPLYSYNQHDDNVVGQLLEPFAGVRHSIRELLKSSRSKRRFLNTARNLAHHATSDFPGVLEKAIFAEALKLRIGSIQQSKQQVLNRVSKIANGLGGPALMKLSAIVQNRKSTLNVEGYLLNIALGIRAQNILFGVWKNRFLDRKTGGKSENAGVAPQVTGVPAAEDLANGWIFQNIKPFRLRVSSREPKRINILLATIDFRYIFGGYIGMFNLALRLRREGFLVRIATLEYTELNIALARERMKGYPGLEKLFDEVEIVHRHDREEELLVSPEDRFVATNCWGAHVAHHASRELGQDRFMFMVQEYEPFFLPMNTVAALFQQSYTFPQFQLFSTPLLRDYFKLTRIGVFSSAGAEMNHAVFRNAIQKFTPSPDDMRHRERRILFYARPEAHAARNLFELGLMALAELARSPDFDADKWKFYGMGSIGGADKVRLAPDVTMEMLPKTDLQTYSERLPSHDVGLSLMLTPHPSLVPLDMASAGMLTVTNTFENKTAEALENISTNLIAVEATLEGVIGGLKEAISRVEQYDQRIQGARLDWPTDWNDAFEPAAIKKIVDFLS